MYNILIDTKLKKQQNGTYKVFLEDNHLKIEDYNANKIYKWFMNIDSFSIMNSFSNITSNINDTIILYREKIGLSTPFITTRNFILNDHIDYFEVEKIVSIPAGNPSIDELIKFIDDELFLYDIAIKYDAYTSKFTLTSKYQNLYNEKYGLNFYKTTSIIFGFNSETFYSINKNPLDVIIKSEISINLNFDYRINLTIGNNSDFNTKKTYSNYNSDDNFLISTICKTFIINVEQYKNFTYNRIVNEPIEIFLLKNYIQNFDIVLTNQDGMPIEQLNYYTLCLNFYYTTSDHVNYLELIFEKLNLIYIYFITFFKFP